MLDDRVSPTDRNEDRGNQINFHYGQAEVGSKAKLCERTCSDIPKPDLKPHKMSEGKILPSEINIPAYQRDHAIIEKTAASVSRGGDQLEELIRTKQKGNSLFQFMEVGHNLHAYYKYILSEMKNGSYESQAYGTQSSDSESNDDYLHPSLLVKAEQSGMQPSNLNDVFKTRTTECTYSMLVSRLRPQALCTANDSNILEFIRNTPPPPDLQPIVDKMAEFVAKNGLEFEESIREKGDPKFAFINQGEKFYDYYRMRLSEYRRYGCAAPLRPVQQTSSIGQPCSRRIFPGGNSSTTSDDEGIARKIVTRKEAPTSQNDAPTTGFDLKDEVEERADPGRRPSEGSEDEEVRNQAIIPEYPSDKRSVPEDSGRSSSEIEVPGGEHETQSSNSKGIELLNEKRASRKIRLTSFYKEFGVPEDSYRDRVPIRSDSNEVESSSVKFNLRSKFRKLKDRVLLESDDEDH